MKFRLLTRQLIISVVLGFLPFAAASFLFSGYVSEQARKERELTTGYHLQSVTQALENVITRFEATTQWIIGNDSIREYLSDSGTDRATHQMLYNRAISQMHMIPFSTNEFSVISVFRKDGEQIESGSRSREPMSISEEEQAKASALKGGWFWTRSGERLAVCRLVRDPENLQHHLGFIKLQLEMEKILKNPAGNPPDEFFALLNSEGEMLYSNAPGAMQERLLQEDPGKLIALEGELTLGGKRTDRTRVASVLRQAIPGKETHVLCISNRDYSLVYSYWHTLLLLSIGLAVIIWALQIFLTNRWMIRPLKKLGTLMENVERENYSVRFHVRGKDEIGDVGSHFNRMCDRLQALYEEVYQSNLSLKEAEIMTMEAEINPHFMFNTLDIIYWMVSLGKQREAMDMIQALSESFRMTLYRTKDGFITLKMAIDQIRNYLFIQKTRLQDQLQYSIEVDPGIDPEHVRVMHMVLQPLVENAIRHGIAKEGGGEVLIMISREEEALIYHIYDSGKHADAEKIQKALTEPPDGTSGLALYNIQSRIRLKFGADYGVTYIRPEDGGSIFLVRQPYTEQGETEEA